jgi:CBS-domain-containing membrane protein
MAVGKVPRTVNGIASTGALAEWWNGKTWTVEKTAVPLGADLIQVYAVSCAARNFCVLVGNYVDSFSSVSCVAAKFCVALGNYGAALSVLAAKWNGRTLKAIAKPPTPPGGAIALLSAISCRTTTWCEAVGSYRSGASPLAEIWNGKTWRIADPTSTTQPK